VAALVIVALVALGYYLLRRKRAKESVVTKQRPESDKIEVKSNVLELNSYSPPTEVPVDGRGPSELDAGTYG
jgi:hypothetical protein